MNETHVRQIGLHSYLKGTLAKQCQRERNVHNPSSTLGAASFTYTIINQRRSGVGYAAGKCRIAVHVDRAETI